MRHTPVCFLCGVPFTAARIRTTHELGPLAWGYAGESYIGRLPSSRGPKLSPCDDNSGCRMHLRQNPPYGEFSHGFEHIAGVGCISNEGYSGHRISFEEMRRCKDVQFLIQKPPGWEPEEYDQDFELMSDYMLTGIGNGSHLRSSFEHVEGLDPVKHGIHNVRLQSAPLYIEDEILFHPTCFEVFKYVSQDRLGEVSLDTILAWQSIPKSSRSKISRAPEVGSLDQDRPTKLMWEPGTEYIVADPVNIPGLSGLLNQYKLITIDDGRHELLINQNAFGRSSFAIPAPASEAYDVLRTLPIEVLYMIIDNLGSKDIASLRFASRSCRELPLTLFRRLLLEDMPWMWELKTIDPKSCDWYMLYKKLKFCWMDLRGLRNRKRIWKEINALLSLVEMHRNDADSAR